MSILFNNNVVLRLIICNVMQDRRTGLTSELFNSLPHPAHCLTLHHLESRLEISGEILFSKRVEIQFPDARNTGGQHLDKALDPGVASKGAAAPVTGGDRRVLENLRILMLMFFGKLYLNTDLKCLKASPSFTKLSVKGVVTELPARATDGVNGQDLPLVPVPTLA